MPVSEEVANEIREQFTLFEKGGNTVDRRDLGALMKSFGVDLSPNALAKLQDECDPGKTNAITLGALLTAFDKMLSPGNFTEEEIIQAFAVFDRNDSGTVNADDLKRVLTQYGSAFSNTEVSDLLYSAQANATGQFNYRDFVRKVMK